jgi:hypothetical protein
MNKSLLLVLLLATGVALADEAPEARRADSTTQTQATKKDAAKVKKKEEAQAKAKEDQKSKDDQEGKGDQKDKDDPNLGMSILGNQEAPKALVIVPWKRSEMGNALGVSTLLDDSRQPIDKEVFMRMLSYYEIRSETAPHVGAPAADRETAPAGTKTAQPAAAHRRKP